MGIAVGLMPAFRAVDGAGRLNRGIKVKGIVRNIGIIAHDVQFTQALRADDLILAVDEHLGAEVHLLTAFGTGVIHIVVLFGCKGSALRANLAKTVPNYDEKSALRVTNRQEMQVYCRKLFATFDFILTFATVLD